MKTLIAAILLFLWSVSPCLAANGDSCNKASDAVVQFIPTARGTVRPVWCVVLLDNTNTASGGPSTYTFGTSTTVGMPDMVSFEVGTDNDCTAGTVSIFTSEIVNGVESGLADPNPTLDLSGAGTTRINVDLNQTPIGGTINTRWTGVSGCTDGADVIMVGYEIAR